MDKLTTTVPGAASPESPSAAANCCEAPSLVAETKTATGTSAAEPAPF